MFRLVVVYAKGNGEFDSVSWYDSKTFEAAFQRARQIKNTRAVGWSSSVIPNLFYRGTGNLYQSIEFSIHDEQGMIVLPGMSL